MAAMLPPLMIMLTCNIHGVRLSPTSLTFPSTVVGSISAPQVVTVTAFGNVSSPITISVSGYYKQSNNCPASLSPGSSCKVTVSFAPNEFGVFNGALNVTNGMSSPPALSLSGQAILPVSFQPASLSFASIQVGKTSPGQPVTLTNRQSKVLAIKQILASGDFSQTNSCPGSLAAGASCTLIVAFHPTSSGSIQGALSVSTDAFPGTQPLGLSGIGSGTVTSHVAFSPRSLNFGNQEAGTASAAKSVILTNTNSSASLTVMTVIPSLGYVSGGTCAGKMIAPGGTCTINVIFQPSPQFASVSYPGSLTVLDSDSTSPNVLGLSGFAVPSVTGSPAALTFGAISSHSSNPQTVTVQNYHSGPETLSISATRDFLIGNDSCSNPLAAGGRCQFQVTFVANGSINQDLKGAITISPSSGGFLSPEVVGLCGDYAVVTPPNLNFGSQPVNTTSAAQTATLTAGGPPNLNISSISITGNNAADFAISNNTCGATVTSSSSCSISMTFTPKATGTRQATLAINDDAGCGPQQISLSGIGQ